MSIKKFLNIKSAQEIVQEKRLALGFLVSIIGWASVASCFMSSSLRAMGVEIKDQRPKITIIGAGMKSSKRFKKKWNKLLGDPSLALLNGYSPAALSYVHACMYTAEDPKYKALKNYVRRPQEQQSPTKRAALEQECVIAILDHLYNIEETKISDQSSKLRSVRWEKNQVTRWNVGMAFGMALALILSNAVGCHYK